MARWPFILAGFALAQGILSLSPVPVPEEEWDEFSRMLRDPAYRLIRTTVPSSYEVTIEPYFDNPPENVEPFTFEGSVVINLSPTQENVNEIVMHCQDIVIESLTVEYTVNAQVTIITEANREYACEMPYAFLKIPVTETLNMNQNYVARIQYRGIIQSNMRGFYRSWYRDSTGFKWMGTTQFQPGHARQAFPCYDEPSFKATFVFTIIRDPDFSPTISNMPMASSSITTNGKVSETFHRTPITSTYLLAFIVSHYKSVSDNENTQRPFSIYARDNVGTNGDWALEVGEQLLQYMESYTGIPYYSMAENMNMKQAAIPDFSAGAMENWGLLTYREALILYDPANTNHFYRQRIANIVAHEIAHMWFGNLVTCAWWDNLWLNEGFARFYQYFLTDAVQEELGFHKRFITEQLHTSLLSDSVSTAHPLTDPSVNDPTSVSAFFSTISYAKGASVLRMTQYLLGKDTYEKGLRAYLESRKYDVAEPQHLFDALDVAAAEDGALSSYSDLTVSSYFKTWSEQAGHPLLTVTINQATGEMNIKQARWDRDAGETSSTSIYTVPITWTRGGSPDFDNLKPSSIMTTANAVLQRGSSGLEWVIFNKQQSGFYRVNYDDTNWVLITRALRGSERTVIHEYNRAHIVDDLFNLARAGVRPYNKVYNVLSFLEFEDEYAPWMAAITGFNVARRRLAHDYVNLNKLQKEIVRLSRSVTARLGFADRDSDSYMDGLLRMNLLDFLCSVGHEECIQAGISHFQKWRHGGEYIPPNMRPWVYCTGLRYGSASDFEIFWQRYLQTDLANEQVVMLEKAGCTTHEASLYKFLDAIVDGNFTVRNQDFTTALNSAVSSNELNTMRVFNWLKNNVEKATATFGSIATPLSYITNRLLTEEQMREVQTWLDANQEIIGSAYNTGVNGIAASRNNLAWSAERMPELVNYLDTGYVAEVLEEELTQADPEADSANIATLGVLTLVVTLAASFIVA